jgi:hypothetical protein
MQKISDERATYQNSSILRSNDPHPLIARSWQVPVSGTIQSDFPRYIQSFKSSADRIPERDSGCLHISLNVEGEPVWLATSGRHLVVLSHRRLLRCSLAFSPDTRRKLDR